ncbi:MAG: DMT family transporter [Jatrophihabitantaceae bacterium]
MSLAVAVPLGIASSIVYGTSIVVQHRASHTAGQEDARHLLGLLRDPRWLTAVIGDFAGFMLNAAALAAGPVVVIQPLVVLMLPVALVVGWLTGGPRPHVIDYLGSAAILVGLGTFLLLIGTPAEGHAPRARYFALAVLLVLVVGVVLCLSVTGRGPTVRGAMYGVAAGTYFGTLGVMVDGASDVVSHRGVSGLVTTGRGLIPLIGIVVLGVAGIVLTQVSFQVGKLAATLPANTAADPFTAVLIGALLLREHVPLSAGHLIGYALCLGVVVAGAIQLARNAAASYPSDAGVQPVRLPE